MIKSFLDTCGEVMICTECNKLHIVTYKDVYVPVQIGDFNVMDQIELNERLFGKNKEGDHTYYYITLSICEICLEKYKKEHENELDASMDPEFLEKITFFCNEHESYIEGIISDYYDYISENLNKDMLNQINPEMYKKITTTKTFGLKKEKVRLATEYAENSLPHIEKYLSKLVKESEKYKQFNDFYKEVRKYYIDNNLSAKGDEFNVYYEIDGDNPLGFRDELNLERIHYKGNELNCKYYYKHEIITIPSDCFELEDVEVNISESDVNRLSKIMIKKMIPMEELWLKK